VGHTGLVVQLVQAAVKFSDLQVTIFSMLQKAFHIESHPKCTAQVILPLVTHEVYAEGNGVSADATREEEGGGGGAVSQALSPTLHGSLLLQALLKYEDSTVVARSLLLHSAEDLLQLCCDPCASHVLTTFFTSSTVSNKKKDKMTTKLLVSLEYAARRESNQVLPVKQICRFSKNLIFLYMCIYYNRQASEASETTNPFNMELI